MAGGFAQAASLLKDLEVDEIRCIPQSLDIK